MNKIRQFVFWTRDFSFDGENFPDDSQNKVILISGGFKGEGRSFSPEHNLLYVILKIP